MQRGGNWRSSVYKYVYENPGVEWIDGQVAGVGRYVKSSLAEVEKPSITMRGKRVLFREKKNEEIAYKYMEDPRLRLAGTDMEK